MKNIFAILFFTVGIFGMASAQAPTIQWAKCLGGTESDKSYSVIQTDDGSYVIAGVTLSPNGDVVGLHGGFLDDMWIIKLDSLGGIVWKKCLGGSVAEGASSIKETYDKGFIISGYATSTDFDVTGGGFHGGLEDFWIVKTDSLCNIQWQKCFGGMNLDWGNCILQTKDSGFVIAGEVESLDGDIDTSYGGGDAWIVKYSNSGNLLWKKMYGGTGTEYVYAIDQLNDGCLIVAGGTNSNDFDATGNHGDLDAWVIKMDQLGNLFWHKCIGGSSGEVFSSVLINSRQQIVLGGGTSSIDGDISGNHGGEDSFIIVLDSTGSTIWQRCYGGFGMDYCLSIEATNDNGYILATSSSSYDSLVTCNNGWDDYYIIKLDSAGDEEWNKCLGGSSADEPWSILQSMDSSYIITGHTYSNDGDVSGHHNSAEWDIWVVKLAQLGLEIQTNEMSIDYLVRFNSFQNLDISFYSDYSEDLSVQVFDLAGKIVLGQTLKVEQGVNTKSLKTPHLSQGLYFVQLISSNGSITKKVPLNGSY